MVVVLRNIAIFGFMIIASGCTTVQQSDGGNWLGFTESGLASFYGDKYQNRKSASGERYRHELKTAAHRTLPFGSNVKVTNMSNNKSVVVTINDRGPFVKGRIIDLSKSAFNAIGNTSAGLLEVDIEVVP
ncbi:septal ring lytic transglycosylase RlpA family protein [Zhongshania guokunii]|uniref:Endolytic peptidoglycan transglycosylase RlpA n=1 Tax=Zhongshania guokunii TaxID=641783 RepID=A0ABV3UB07_9GAMM